MPSELTQFMQDSGLRRRLQQSNNTLMVGLFYLYAYMTVSVARFGVFFA